MTDDEARQLLETVRLAVDRLITRGMSNPQSVSIAGNRGTLVMLDDDDHVSDETIGGGRRRTLIRDEGTLLVVIQRAGG